MYTSILVPMNSPEIAPKSTVDSASSLDMESNFVNVRTVLIQTKSVWIQKIILSDGISLISDFSNMNGMGL